MEDSDFINWLKNRRYTTKVNKLIFENTTVEGVTQQIITIFRTVYNFCTLQGSGPIENRKTPAMKMGIANKLYTYKDILYFR